jgi:hypothetical protein
MRKLLSMIRYIKARYIDKDLSPMVDPVVYQKGINQLIQDGVFNTISLITYDEIKSFINKCIAVGITRLSSSFNCYTVETNESWITFPSSVIEAFFSIKQNLLSMDYKKLIKEDGKDFYGVLAWCLIIPTTWDTLQEKFLNKIISDAFLGKELFKDLKEVTVEDKEFHIQHMYEVPSQPTLIGSFFEAVLKPLKGTNEGMDNKITVRKGNYYQNKFGNKFLEVFIMGKNRKESRPSEFRLLLPVCEEGIYFLGDTKFILKKRAIDLFANAMDRLMKEHIQSFLWSQLRFSRFYTLSATNVNNIGQSIQQKILDMFYSQQILRPSKREKLARFPEACYFESQEAEKIARESFDEQGQFYWNFFVPVHSVDGFYTLTQAEIYLEMIKFHFAEHLISVEGKNILELKKGFGYYPQVPYGCRNMYDPTIVDNNGTFVLAKRKDGVMLAEELDPFWTLAGMGVRAYLGTYTLLHAKRVDNWLEHKPLVKSTNRGFIGDMIPGYYIWTLFIQWDDSNGFCTDDGMVGFQKVSRLYHGIKYSLPRLEKGQSFSMDDEIVFFPTWKQGAEISLATVNPVNSKGRLNDPETESRFNAKLVETGNTKGIIRDFTLEPIKNEELLDMQEVFLKRGDGTLLSLGVHPVGLSRYYFVKDVYSTDYEELNEETSEFVFVNNQSYLGTEAAARAVLLGSQAMVDAMYGSEDKQLTSNLKIDSIFMNKNIYNKCGKRGRIVKKFYKARFNSLVATVLARHDIKINDVYVELLEKDIEGFLKNLPIPKEYLNIDDIKQRILSGEKVEVNCTNLDTRNPSMTNTNFITVNVFMKLAHPKAKFSYVTIHSSLWFIQGGDYDGDLISLMFLSLKYKRDLHRQYGYHNYLDEIPKRQKYLPTSFSNIKDYYRYYAELKKGKAYADKVEEIFFDGDNIKQRTRAEVMALCEYGTITTLIGKTLIGIAKSITMKSMDYITTFMQKQNDYDPEISKRLTKYCDVLNTKYLGQPAIDIQKWSSELRKVIRIAILAYQMSEVVSLAIESHGITGYPSFMLLKENLIETGVIVGGFVTNNYIPGSNKVFNYLFENELIPWKRFIVEDESGELLFVYNEKIKNVHIESVVEVLNPEGPVFKLVLEVIENKLEGFEKSELSKVF